MIKIYQRVPRPLQCEIPCTRDSLWALVLRSVTVYVFKQDKCVLWIVRKLIQKNWTTGTDLEVINCLYHIQYLFFSMILTWSLLNCPLKTLKYVCIVERLNGASNMLSLSTCINWAIEHMQTFTYLSLFYSKNT